MMIRVSFCCNDQRGNFTGKVDAVDFHDRRGFEARLQGPTIRFDHETDGAVPGRVKVGRRKFEVTEYRYGVGNWCWDGVAMSQAESQRLLTYLLERGFQVEEWTTSGGPFARIIEEHRGAA